MNMSSNQSGFMKNKAIFLDRDGVVNETLVDETGYRHSPRRLEDLKIDSEMPSFVRFAKDLSYLVIVITSQPEVKRGLIEKETLDAMHEAIKEKTGVDDIFVCLHDDEDDCDCRKPKPGMLLDASKKWDINLKESFFIGDTWRDVDAGKAAGVKTILIDYDYNKDAEPDMRAGSLADATKLI